MSSLIPFAKCDSSISTFLPSFVFTIYSSGPLIKRGWRILWLIDVFLLMETLVHDQCKSVNISTIYDLWVFPCEQVVNKHLSIPSRSSTRSSTPLGIALLGGILAATWRMKQSILSTSTWVRSQYSCSNLVEERCPANKTDWFYSKALIIPDQRAPPFSVLLSTVYGWEKGEWGLPCNKR